MGMLLRRFPVAQGTFPLTLTETLTELWDGKATGDLATGWSPGSTLAYPQVFVASGTDKLVQGSTSGTRPNCRADCDTLPGTVVAGTFSRVVISGFASRCGLRIGNGVQAYLTSSTSLVVGTLTSSTSSTLPTVVQTFTVPAVSYPCEILAAMNSTTSVSVYLNRVLVGTVTVSARASRSCGIFPSLIGDVISEYGQGTFV